MSVPLFSANWQGENPLLSEWQRTRGDTMGQLQQRRLMAAMFSWAIPNEPALKLIASFSPIIEIGAGTGYWAHMLMERGADIIAYDHEPPSTHENHFHSKRDCFFPVQQGSDVSVSDHADRTLFLCWPPYSDPMAANCLRRYKGARLVYVGEGDGGCCGDDDFWTEIEKGWKEVQSVAIPQWYGLHDALTVYERDMP